MFDIVVKNGTLVDGTGAPGRRADVALRDGRVVAIDTTIDAHAREIIDASGRIVTPGFVDPHSHFDGQATWDTELGPTSWHGVTTTVMGNCGVGFAPIQPGTEPYLIQLMEGVEDIPGTALYEGITWGWETFPEYLDVVGGLRRSIDVGASMPHGSLRFYVMGERSVSQQRAGADDIATMGRLTREAIEAGALAVSTNRLASHRAKDGTPVPGTFADGHELRALSFALRDGGAGLLQVTGALAMGYDLDTAFDELDMYARLSIESEHPVLFSLTEVNQSPDFWRRALEHVEKLNGFGARLIVQTQGRPTGLVVGWETFNPFAGRAGYDALASLPIGERLERLREPATRQAILQAVGVRLPHDRRPHLRTNRRRIGGRPCCGRRRRQRVDALRPHVRAPAAAVARRLSQARPVEHPRPHVASRRDARPRRRRGALQHHLRFVVAVVRVAALGARPHTRAASRARSGGAHAHVAPGRGVRPC
jgi:N-acyl-D-amino-acid deacylase